MPHSDVVVAELRSMGISPSNVFFINPKLASAPLPPPSTSNNPCTADCPNLITAVDNAITVARLQIENARLQIRQQPLIEHVEHMKATVHIAGDMLESYEKLFGDTGAAIEELVGICSGAMSDLRDTIGGPGTTAEQRQAQFYAALGEVKGKIVGWSAKQAEVSVRFSAEMAGKRESLHNQLAKQAGY